MNKYEERNYAPRQRKIEKSDLQKHSDRSESRQTCETSSSHSLFCSRQEQKEEIIQLLGISEDLEKPLPKKKRKRKSTKLCIQ